MSRVGHLLFFITLLLTFLGIFILYESSSYTALLNVGDSYYFIKNQVIATILGIIVCLVVSRFSYKNLYHLALPFLLGTIFCLFLVFIPGLRYEANGATRWVNLGFTVFQPSELLKITLSLYLAAWLSNKEKRRLGAFLLLFGLCIGMVALQPDMGTALIIASTSIILYFLSGAKIQEMAVILLIVIVTSLLFIKVAPYRAARFAAFSNFDTNKVENAPYHMKQMLIAVGAGGVLGQGFGNSIQKYAYLPENTTDSIFAIFAEEAGFLGSSLLIALLLIQLFIGYYIAVGCKDTFGRLLACGITTFLGIQAFLNLGSQVVLVPLTGVPLPFISYGGSSMLINYLSIGVLLSISSSSGKMKRK